MGHEEVEEPVLRRGDLDPLAVGTDPMADVIDAQTGDLDPVGLLFGLDPPQHGIDARDHFTRGERLGDVIVRPRVQPFDAIFLFTLRANHDDREGTGCDALFELPSQLQPGTPRQHPIEQHQIRVLGPEELTRLVRMAGLIHPKPRSFEGESNHFSDIGFVIDNKDTRHR